MKKKKRVVDVLIISDIHLGTYGRRHYRYMAIQQGYWPKSHMNVTLIIQSSSATVGMVITLAKKGLLSLSAGVAVMLGAELGTCADTLLATIGSDRQSLKTGLFHLSFNVISIFLALIIFPMFVQLVEKISGNVNLEQKIATAHMMFNISGVLLFLPFTGLVERLLNTILPQKVVERVDNYAMPHIIAGIE